MLTKNFLTCSFTFLNIPFPLYASSKLHERHACSKFSSIVLRLKSHAACDMKAPRNESNKFTSAAILPAPWDEIPGSDTPLSSLLLIERDHQIDNTKLTGAKDTTGAMGCPSLWNTSLEVISVLLSGNLFNPLSDPLSSQPFLGSARLADLSSFFIQQLRAVNHKRVRSLKGQDPLCK